MLAALTDTHCNRFFWLALYAQPGLWVALAIFAILKFEFKWLSLVGKSILFIFLNWEQSMARSRGNVCLTAALYLSQEKVWPGGSFPSIC